MRWLGLALAALVFVLLAVPETKGKSLEELEHFLVRRSPSAGTTRYDTRPKERV